MQLSVFREEFDLFVIQRFPIFLVTKKISSARSPKVAIRAEWMSKPCIINKPPTRASRPGDQVLKFRPYFAVRLRLMLRRLYFRYRSDVIDAEYGVA